jgi:N-acetylglucosamine-6-sulfatase
MVPLWAGTAGHPGPARRRHSSFRPKVPEQEHVTKRLGAAIVAAAVVIVLATAGREPSPADGHLDAAVASQQAGTPSGQRPNIVFVLTDDLTQNLISDMPHVQALAQAGSAMSQYYVVDSLCCPSRSAIFTGQYPHDNGVYTNKGSDGGYQAFNQHGDPQKSFAVALQKSGYRTALMGKYLNGYFPVFGEPPGWDEWDAGGNAYTNFNYALNENGRKQYFGRDPRDYLTDVLSAKAGSFISSAASSGKPFMLEVATFAPHAPYTPAPRYANTASLATYPETGAYDKLPKHPPSWLKGQPALNAARTHRIAKAYRRRVESVGAVDDMIGHLEDQLRASGAARNTYFLFSSDNGYHMGEYQLMPGKQTAFDTDIHVPLIVSGPGVPAGKTISQLASNIDLNPTFERLAGLSPPGDVDGHSLADLWHGQHPANWRQAILVEHHGPDNSTGDPDRQDRLSGNPPSYEAVRTATALYVRYASGEQEYYDTARDPLELDNIASAGVPAVLRSTLAALQNCHGGVSCWAAAHLTAASIPDG